MKLHFLKNETSREDLLDKNNSSKKNDSSENRANIMVSKTPNL
jgi:hypothetical protein